MTIIYFINNYLEEFIRILPSNSYIKYYENCKSVEDFINI